MKSGQWIMTASGKRFDYETPKMESIDIEDIATALSNTCRYSGHCGSFYSVAEHSVLVSFLVDQEMIGAPFAGLMHDAAEAYCCDVPLPLKESMRLDSLPRKSPYHDIIGRVETAIRRKFIVRHNEEVATEVKYCDVLSCLMEAKTFFGHRNMADWPFYSPDRIAEGYERLGLVSFECRPDFFKGNQGMTPRSARTLFLERFHELYHP